MKNPRILSPFRPYYLSLFLSIQFVAGWAQTPYQLRWQKEAVLIGAGAASLLTSYELGRRLTPLDVATVQTLNRQAVNAFDRGATYRWAPGAARLSDVTNAVGFAGVALISVPTLKGQDWATVPVMFAETVLLVNGIHRSVKSTAKRTRPYAFNPAVPLDEKLTKDTRRSFFSGHASNAFATAVFTADVFSHYFPRSKLKPLVWGGSLTLASVTAVSRYRAGLHYPTDLLVGAAFGSLVGWGIPKLHQTVTATTHSALFKQMRVQPWSNGLASGVHVQIGFHSSAYRFKP